MQSIGPSTDGPFYPFWPFYGYSYLGPIQVPPLSSMVAMTDRVTGAVWYLAFDPCQNGRICLLSQSEVPLSTILTVRPYAPYDGPFIGPNGLKLGVSNAHLLFDTAPGDSGGGPFAFDKSGNKQLWMQLAGLAYKNPNQIDHLTYQGVPWFFFGLTDTVTGLVWYVSMDPSTKRIKLIDSLPPTLNANVITRIRVYPAFQGPGFGTSGLGLTLTNGHLIANAGTKQFVLIPTLAFQDNSDISQAALFMGANVNGPFGIEDILPDHVAYNIVDPTIDECSGQGDSLLVLTDEFDNPLFSDDGTTNVLVP